MKFKRQLVAVGSAVALAAAGASVALIGGSSASVAAEVPSSAYGIQSSGLLPLGPLPSVVSKDGKLKTDSLVALPAGNGLLTGGVVNVQAQNDAAEADVTNLKLSGKVIDQLTGALAPVASALQPVCDALNNVDTSQLNNLVSQTGSLLNAIKQLTTTVNNATGIDLTGVGGLDLSHLLPAQLGGLCDALSGKAGLLNVGAVTTECHGHAGSVDIANLTALGLPVNVDTSKANSKISLPGGLLTITVNKQTKNADGTFTVEGLEVDLLNQLKLVVTSATCGHITARPTPPPTHPTKHAPAPHPVHTRAPVTG